jgi:RND family efflux transporter MFP subunit
VLEVGAVELDRVEAGQLLVRIDPTLAEVATLRARAAIARAESEGTLARANLERNQGLAGRNVSSRAALDEAENSARLAKASRLEAQAALAEAEDRLAKKTIVAPFAGALRSFPVEKGEYVRPGERVAELLDVARLRITIGLNDRQVVDVRPGAMVGVRVDARPGEPIMGQVVRVGGAIDLTTRKFPVEIEVDNAEARLLPGMVARVLLTLGEPRPLVAIPLDAIMEEYGLEHVFVVLPAAGADEATRVQKRRIETGPISFRPTEREVLAGLQPGERIATTSVRQLRDGMAVRPLPGDGAGAISQLEAPQ